SSSRLERHRPAKLIRSRGSGVRTRMTPSTDDLEQIEIDAWRDCCAAAPPDFAEAVGLETAELDGPLLAMCKRIDHYQFNRLMGGGLAGDKGGSLAIAIDRFRGA